MTGKEHLPTSNRLAMRTMKSRFVSESKIKKAFGTSSQMTVSNQVRCCMKNKTSLLSSPVAPVCRVAACCVGQ